MSARFHISCRGQAAACVASLAALVFAAPAAAANKVRYISTTGNDANNCTMASPCRTLQRGLNRTPVAGELRILESGDYGENGNVKRSLTIAGNGHAVTIANPITVMSADAVVTLRELVLNGQGSTQQGIVIVAAKAVHVERCVVHSFVNDGIRLETSAELFVSDSVSRGNGQDGLDATSTAAKVTVDNSRFENNGNIGIYTENVESTITRSVSSGNGGNGIHAHGGRMNVTSTTSAHNNLHGFVVTNAGDMVLQSSVARGNTSRGLYVFSGTGTVSNSVFTHNGIGIDNNPTSLTLTFENNVVRRNGDDIEGVLTPATPQ